MTLAPYLVKVTGAHFMVYLLVATKYGQQFVRTNVFAYGWCLTLTESITLSGNLWTYKTEIVDKY